MKELSIEQKAKAYDELFIKAKQIYNKENDVLIMHTIEDLFPEVKEPDGEKIRKALIEHFKFNVQQILYDFSNKDVLAWLEKRGEKKPLGYVHHIDEDGYYTKEAILEPNPYTGTGFDYKGHHWGMCARDGGVEILMDGNITSRVFPDKNNIIEQKPTDSYCQENCKGYQETGKCFADGMCNAKREAEQKPEENKGNIGGISLNWSDDDERMLDYVIGDILSADTLIGGKETASYKCDWLKSLKGRVQPKQEWSKEDDGVLLESISVLQNNGHWVLADKLKSLRPQNTYNPHKAVVESIAEMCKHYDKASHSGLRDFYDNVKVKCKEAQEYDKMFPQAQLKLSDEQIGLLQAIINEPNNASSESCQIVLKDILEQLKKLKEKV